MKTDDVAKLAGAPKRLADPFVAFVEHLDKAASYVEEVYQLDQRGAWADKENQRARELVHERLASGATLLRDLAYTAWVESDQAFRFTRDSNPIDPKHPAYNPATGSAPPGPPGETMRLFAALLPVLLLGQPVALTSPVQDKVLYVLSLLKRNPVKSTTLDEIGVSKRTALQQPGSPIEALRWTPEEIAAVSGVLKNVATFDAPPRASGFYVRDPQLVKAWEDAATGINRILDFYGLFKPSRYSAIDSVSFDLKSPNYGRMVLRANLQDEAGRFEPMEKGENRAAYERVSKVNWSQFRYMAIVLPGSGTDRPSQALWPWGKARATLAARRFKADLAPFLNMSGG